MSKKATIILNKKDVNSQMRDALGVITQDPNIKNFLERKDPMALKQANAACDNYDRGL